MSVRLAQAIELLEAELAGLAPERVEGARACALVEQFSFVERLAGAGKALALRQVAATGAWKRQGAYRDVAEWLASVAKLAPGQAQTVTRVAARLGELPEVETAARAGELSGAQLDVITDAAMASPGAERALLECASRDGLGRLRTEATRVKAGACADEGAREDRIRAQRSLRHWVDADGAGRIDVRGPVVDVARVVRALVPHERVIFDARRGDELRERPDAYAFDALVALAEEPATSTVHDPAAKPSERRCEVVVRIDHTALLRGHTIAGEACEIAGVGPVPVHEASRLLDDSFVKVVVTKGIDVMSVGHAGRTIPAALCTAIEARDQECVLRGCGVTRHLEIDHNVPVEHGGRTELANLHRLCLFHHRYKHRYGLRLAGDGRHKCFVTVDGLPPPDG